MIQNKSNLEWIDETIPHSVKFDDTYYSKADGLAETEHTFIDGNQLKDRFKKAGEFTIAELGFGTGLNFLVAKHFWQRYAPKQAQLQFISFEQYPMTYEEMEKSLSRWLRLKEDAKQLAEFWQDENEIRTFRQDNIQLNVYIGDANLLLPKLDIKADAWFLDGFSPAKNPELWNETLMNIVGGSTKSNGTFATYTSAGFVRRGLTEAGFEVSKQPGHAGKREMSVGVMRNG